MGSDKSSLRKHYRDLRDRLSADHKADLDLRISLGAQALVDASAKSAETPSAETEKPVWTSYMPVRNEVDPQPLMACVNSVAWAFPRVQNETMKFWIPTENSGFQAGVYGIPEPDIQTSREVAAHEIVGCLVPALAFDRRGHRLGSGKGFYDRFLSNFSGRTVGLAYGFQITETRLPIEATDIPVQFIVTENEVITCG